MPIVVGVSFKKAGKIYHFGINGLNVSEGMHVVTETARGWRIGCVVANPKEITEDEVVGTLKEIERIATEEDLAKELEHKKREISALEICAEKIEKHKLPMRLLDAELSFDESVITFSFSSDGRVDFRDLVKDVAGALRLKVQLLQIGVRDEAKLVGGYGSCGRQLCCSLFLTNFEPVSMKMAKDQSLFLNPAKFSGCCGKLMCCLRYENEYYSQMQKTLPSVGSIIETDSGPAKIQDYNVIAHTVILHNAEGVTFNLPMAKVSLVGACKKHGCKKDLCGENCQCVTNEELESFGVTKTPKKVEEEIVISLPSYGEKSISFDFLDDESSIGVISEISSENIVSKQDDNSSNNNNNRRRRNNRKINRDSAITPKPGVSQNALSSDVTPASVDTGTAKVEKPSNPKPKVKTSPKPFKINLKSSDSDLGIVFRDVKDGSTAPAKKPQGGKPQFRRRPPKAK